MPREGGEKSVSGRGEGTWAHFSKWEHMGRSSCRQRSVWYLLELTGSHGRLEEDSKMSETF